MSDQPIPESVRATGQELRTSVARLWRRMRSERAVGDLGDSALAVLTRIALRGPQSLTELSDYERVTPASMSQVVNRLTSAGLAVREKDPGDGRRVLFRATEAGGALALAERQARHDRMDRVLAALPPDDLAALRRASELLRGLADDD